MMKIRTCETARCLQQFDTRGLGWLTVKNEVMVYAQRPEDTIDNRTEQAKR